LEGIRVRPKLLVLSLTIAALNVCVLGAGGAYGASDRHSAARAAHEGGTLTTLWSSVGASIDPGIDYDQNVILLRLPYHGLVGFQRRGGIAGNTVVPDLATALPKVSADGLTWKFTLRPGVSFSNGKPVTAKDFVWTFERQFKMNGPATGIYGAIAGAAACVKTPASCNLSKGIVANNATRSITIKLAHRDPDFLNKLAMTFGSVVPTGTPAKDSGAKPVPATGTYMISNYTANQSLTFVRNPKFKSWSDTAAPRGYVDKIVVKIGQPVDSEVNAVANGQADWSFDSPPNNRLDEIATKYPDQLHLSGLPWIYYMALGTRVPPFDNVKVRQAVNFATDRAAVIKLFGGPALATPTCQILPTDFPASKPFCPYTKGASASGAGPWTAPDLAKAKQLIASSGTKGMAVKVFTGTDPFSTSVGGYFVSLLNQLGYKAQLKRLASNVLSPYVANSKNKVQMALTYWLADYPAPSNFLTIPVGCSGFQPNSSTSTNWSGFCDKRIDAIGLRASKLQLTDPAGANALWTQVDQKTTMQAPWVPMFVAKYAAFVSKRLGNYEFASTAWLMLDRVWVQ
jgi:peptide/nickel transport system substrate-binding protein